LCLFLLAPWGPAVFAGESPLAGRIREAEALEKAGKLEEAIAAWKKIVLDFPKESGNEFHTVIHKTYTLLSGLNRTEELLRFLREVGKGRPGDPYPKIYLATVLETKGEYEEAKKIYRAIGEGRGPHAPWAYGQIGKILVEKEKNPDKAEALYRSLLKEKEPLRSFVKVQLGRLLLKYRSMVKEAAALFREVTEADTECAWEAYDQLGYIRVFHLKKSDQEAADLYLASLLRNPKNTNAVRMANWIAGNRELKERDFKNSRTIWQTIAGLEGVDPVWRARCHLYVGMQYYRLGEFNKALIHIIACEYLNPNDPEPPNNMGLVYLAMGNRKKALECWKKSLALNAEYADALENLGVFHWRRDRKDEAKGFFLKGYGIAVKALEVARKAVSEARQAGKKQELIDLEYRWRRARFRHYRFDFYLRRYAALD
ncbi:MAG: tetratricopeptide repeat protein, partial [Planctomycetota bacterium]